MTIAALYGSHDATLAILNEDGKLWNFEFERYFGERHWRFPAQLGEAQISAETAICKAMDIAHVNQPEVCYYQMMPNLILNVLKTGWPDCEFIWQPHHPSHAAGAFVQSGLDEAIVVSYDGGGPDDPSERDLTSFKIFHATWKKDGSVAGIPNELRDSLLFATGTNVRDVLVRGGRDVGPPTLTLIKEYPWNLGIGYGLLGWSLDSIKKHGGDYKTEFLKFAGKIMGLSAYGTPLDVGIVDREMVEALRYPHIGTSPGGHRPENQILGWFRCREEDARDDASLAAAMQETFEAVFWGAYCGVVTYQSPEDALPIIATGGCALNVIVNQTISMEGESFVPPNPGDNGIPFGMLCLNGHITEPVPYLHYSGWPILDEPPEGGRRVDVDELATMLADGKVIGVMRGQSEHGPRALGNRSILCDPRAGMKDHLNQSIKFREDFRPYAPVIRQEIANGYFAHCPDSPYMSYSPRIVEKMELTVGPDIVHVDGTSRVQTVTREQNPWLYDLLLAFEEKSGRVCLLNTSFNSRGKPIMTTCAEAMKMLEETALDGVLIEGVLYE